MPERIQRLSRGRGKNTVVVVAGGRRYEIARDAAVELGLAPGLELTDSLRVRLEAAAERRRAAVLALRYLRRRPRTEHEMRGELQRAGFVPAVVEAVLAELRQQSLVDDARFAHWFVEAARVHRPRSGAALVQELCARGVPRALAESAARGGQGLDDTALAVEVGRARLPRLRGLPRRRAASRLARYLSGRGFDEETVHDACETLLGPLDELAEREG